MFTDRKNNSVNHYLRIGPPSGSTESHLFLFFIKEGKRGEEEGIKGKTNVRNFKKERKKL